ncbi:nucleotidyltransferase domain-containing protein [Clostridium sp. BJN0001]|uniref:nucleotidyltransferase domain-containing protein n=1 Tax=Clostridium sp. BJN0001 TaxID=2930219 RepID=UPI001FD5E356|nr:nucleotidyltransferase domain-containing protein [Clostridium sp. BJN0001]
MTKSIMDYQKASNKLINHFKNNEKVLAIFAFGSIVSGDLWEESDIDIFIVYKDNFMEIRDVYSKILGVNVHMKLLCKKKLIEIYNSEHNKGIVKNILSSSKIIFSRDDEIERLYNKSKYDFDDCIEKWNLVYLGNTIKNIGVVKKYMHNDNIVTSYEVLIRSLDELSKLYLNLNGYTITKDSVNMAMNFNNKFNEIVNELFNSEISEELIKKALAYFERYIDENLFKASKVLLDFLDKKESYLSSYEIKKDDDFKDFNIRTEIILKELSKKKFIVRDSRKLKLETEEELIIENVYAYNDRLNYR